MSSAAVVVAFDPQKCVLLNVGEVAPGLGVDEFLFVGGEIIRRRALVCPERDLERF